MTHEEIAIMNFLQGNRAFVARREIARKALRRQVFEEDPHWADIPLAALVDRGELEQDDSGHFRIKKFEG